MSHQQIANQVLTNIKNKDKASAVNNLQHLIDENAALENLWGGLARLAISIGEIDLALICAKKFLSVDENDVQRNIQVASVYAETGRFEEALSLLIPFAEKQENISINHLLGTIYSQVGKKELALLHCRKALIKNPMLGITWLSLAALKRFTPEDRELETLRAMESRVTGDDVQNDIPYWYAFGKALLDIGENEQAFDKFSRGARLMNKKVVFNMTSHKTTIDQVIETQTKEFFEGLPSVNPLQGKGLIFIIGLPRSGTTLLQQLLTCHPEIGAGGESNLLAIALAPFQHQLLKGFDSEQQVGNACNTIAHEYQKMMHQRFASNGMLIDKSFNINQQLGILTHVFPAASFIHINRKKAETAWSCYRTYFSQGITWSNSIANIKEYFDADERLIAHWKSFLSDKITEIQYEDLVFDPKGVLTTLCQKIGIRYDEAFTSFHENPHPVQTASVGQVRGPLTQVSVNLPKEIYSYFNHF